MGLNVGMITTWRTRCGIATYSEKLAKALAKQGVNVYIIRIPRFGNKEPSIFQNVVDRIPLDKIDVIHCQHEYGLYGALNSHFFPAIAKLGKPLVTTMHAVGNWEDDAIIADNSNKIIVHNEFCRDRFVKSPEGKVCIIPHGMTPLQTPLPPKAICKKRLGIQPEAPIVGYLGFISRNKGLEVIIDTMVDIPNAALLIGGGWFVESETEYTISLKERTLKLLPNRCQWVGFVPDEELSLVYGAMDLVVYPSRYMTESGALLMAVSHGKAVIASDIAPVREKAKKGALLTFKDPKDLFGKITQLLSDQKLREQYEQCATEFAKENSWENVAKHHVALYQSLLNTRS